MKSEAKKLPTFGREFPIYNIMNSFFVVFPYLRLIVNASRLTDAFLQNSSLREYILIPPWHSATLTSTGSVGGYVPTILLQISHNLIFFLWLFSVFSFIFSTNIRLSTSLLAFSGRSMFRRGTFACALLRWRRVCFHLQLFLVPTRNSHNSGCRFVWI